ncbi:hypothetical protein LUZ60_016164 [Juncus effusus]|nr:hypothetical protein LUZ60_016164 [Juncus effusus]
MKNSLSDKNIFIDSEEEDDEADENHVEEGGKHGSESDGSDSSSDDSEDAPRGSRPNSYTNQWPQSYRQSIDMYSYMGTPSLSKLSGSFLTNSFVNKNPPEILSSLIKPLLPTKSSEELSQQQQQQSEEEIKSSHSILVGGVSRKSSLGVILEDKKFDAHGFEAGRQCSYTQAVMNGLNVLCGVGILSAPYAVKQGGLIGLSMLFVFAVLGFYTGILLRKCLDSKHGIETYPDIGHEAFGTTGRILISIVLYVELYACCVEYIILESDNLSSLFPNAHLNIGGIYLNSHIFFAILTTLIVLPTTWLRDLSLLSYISAGGVVASFLIVMSLFWLGIIDHVGFESKNDSLLDLSGMPIAIGLYGYCYSGHAVFPNIYSSLKKKEQFPSVLFSSFGICTILFAGVAILGYLMFGESTESQFTLNLPQNLVASKIAVWTTVVNPITKYPFLPFQ